MTKLNYYDDIARVERRELGVDMVCYTKRGGYTEIVAIGPYTDAASIFDHSANHDVARELRNALRRHARWVKGSAK